MLWRWTSTSVGGGLTRDTTTSSIQRATAFIRFLLRSVPLHAGQRKTSNFNSDFFNTINLCPGGVWFIMQIRGCRKKKPGGEMSKAGKDFSLVREIRIPKAQLWMGSQENEMNNLRILENPRYSAVSFIPCCFVFFSVDLHRARSLLSRYAGSRPL